MDPEGPSSSEEGKSRKSYRHAPLHSLTTWLTFAILAAILFNFLFRDELPSGRQNRLLQSGIWERIVEASLLESATMIGKNRRLGTDEPVEFEK